MIQQQLASLEAAGLVRLAHTLPELKYLFRHALVQETAYHSLVREDRRRLHQAAGEVFERLFAERLESRELAPLLGRHFLEAGDDARALRYFTLAGRAAADAYANREAAQHFAQALDAAGRAPVDGEQWTRLYAGRGQALELNAQYAEALANYEQMESLARARRDRAMQCAAMLARAKIHATPNPFQNPDEAQALLQQALALARELGDPAAESKVLWSLMVLLVYSVGDQRQAITYGEASQALARQHRLHEQLAYTLNDLAYAYVATDQFARAMAAVDEARELWRAVGNQPMLTDSLSVAAMLHCRAGAYAEAQQCAEEGLRLSQAIHNAWGQAGNHFWLSRVHVERGDLGAALRALEAAIHWAEPAGHLAAWINAHTELGWAYAQLGAHEQGLTAARAAQGTAKRVSMLRLAPIVILARLHVRLGDLTSAEAAVEAGYRELKREGLQMFFPIQLRLAHVELRLAQRQYARAAEAAEELLAHLAATGGRAFVPETLFLKSQAVLGDQPDALARARALLTEARDAAQAMGARLALWSILWLLAEVEERQGMAAEAAGARAQAREIVRHIADQVGADELRQAFLGRPDVQAALAA